jgi:hypothetical protein
MERAPSPGTSIDESERRTKIPARRGVAEPSCCCCCCETHDAHTLRTPKHEGLYRYGRRCVAFLLLLLFNTTPCFEMVVM